jgi:hypothetical protein
VVWRATRSDGDDDEHDDFQTRVEQRRQQEIEHTLERQKAIVARLGTAHLGCARTLNLTRTRDIDMRHHVHIIIML